MSSPVLDISDGAIIRTEPSLCGVRLKFFRAGRGRGADRASLDGEKIVAAFASAVQHLVIEKPLACGEQKKHDLDDWHLVTARSTGDAKEATVALVTLIDGGDDESFTIYGRDDLVRLANFLASIAENEKR